MWQKQNDELYKKFSFQNFTQAYKFIDQVARLAELHNIYPRWQNQQNIVEIWVSKGGEGAAAQKDLNLTKEIDNLVGNNQQEILVSDKKPGHHLTRNQIKTPAKLYADGGSRGNPGPSAGGFVIFDKDDTVLLESGKYLGITTNNQAEYHSLKGGIEAAVKLNIQELDVYMDSLLVVNQMKGIYKIRNRDLWPIHEAIKQQLVHIKKVKFTHVPRELNKHADSLVNQILDSEAKNSR